jgi:hypothetical protein
LKAVTKRYGETLALSAIDLEIGSGELFQRLGDGPYIASALGAWAMLLLTLVLLAVNSLLGKRVGALFRI